VSRARAVRTVPVARSARPARKEGYHHGDLKRALLDATLRLVEENGPQGFTLRAAARAAGVTPGATYHHFDHKDALIAAVAEESFDLFRQSLETAAKREAASARDRSRNVGVAYVLWAVANPVRFRLMVGYGVQAHMSQGEVGASSLATYRVVREVLVEGLKHDRDEKISNAEVLGWWSVVHGLAFLAIDGHLGPARSSTKQTERIVREVLDALDARGRE
jgi:AcrR family transcriptional regulator